MCVLSINVPKKSGNLFNEPYIYIIIVIWVGIGP